MDTIFLMHSHIKEHEMINLNEILRIPRCPYLMVNMSVSPPQMLMDSDGDIQSASYVDGFDNSYHGQLSMWDGGGNHTDWRCRLLGHLNSLILGQDIIKFLDHFSSY